MSPFLETVTSAAAWAWEAYIYMLAALHALCMVSDWLAWIGLQSTSCGNAQHKAYNDT